MPSYLKTPTFRSEPLRRAVASLECMACGRHGRTQAAHANEGKGMAMKVSDALLAALCDECHTELDQGKTMTREERRDFWNRAHIHTMQALVERGLLVTKR